MEWAWLRSSLEKPLVRRVNRRRDIRNVGVLGYFKKTPRAKYAGTGGFRFSQISKKPTTE